MYEVEAHADKTRDVRGYRVLGKVQGVGFRWWTRREALRLGIVGSVRNLADGSVWVVGAGTADDLERFEGSLRHGPPLAVVERVERVEAAVDMGCTEFTVEG